jgi:uncharacterized protein (TIGR02145 family)
VKDADGNKYNTVKIGTQVWTVENLKTTKYNNGNPIPNVTDNDEWAGLTTGAYCNYDNLESNVATYGRLYNWYAVNTGKLAPEGWHVPTDDDWIILEEYLIANGYNYDGTLEENKLAKSLGAKTGWELDEYSFSGSVSLAPEKNNSTGFSALPGGGRSCDDGIFGGIRWQGYWWSSSESFKNYAYSRAMNCVDEEFYELRDSNKRIGKSVRLVKDN